MKITFKKGNGDKIHLHLDSEYYMTVDEAYFVSLGLKNGQEIDEDYLEELTEKINCRRAYNQRQRLNDKLLIHVKHPVVFIM